MNSVSNIEKLNSDNYSTWSIQVKSLLITMDLWDVVIGNPPTEESKLNIWKVNDQKALATINLSVKPSELIHVKDCKSTKSAWETLSALYKANTACRKVNLFKSLVRFKVRPGEKATTQIGEFRAIIDDLKSIGVELNDDFVSVLLLCSLPDEMENFVVAVESRDSLPNIEQLISKVLEEERRQSDKNVPYEEKVLFATNTKYENFAKNSNTKGNKKNCRYDRTNRRSKAIKCFNCGKKGHIRAQCQVKENESVAAVFSALHDLSESDDWILDSGATSHMCRQEDMFVSLEKKRQQIILASGDVVFAEGKGTVKLK